MVGVDIVVGRDVGVLADRTVVAAAAGENVVADRCEIEQFEVENGGRLRGYSVVVVAVVEDRAVVVVHIRATDIVVVVGTLVEHAGELDLRARHQCDDVDVRLEWPHDPQCSTHWSDPRGSTHVSSLCECVQSFVSVVFVVVDEVENR